LNRGPGGGGGGIGVELGKIFKILLTQALDGLINRRCRGKKTELQGTV